MDLSKYQDYLNKLEVILTTEDPVLRNKLIDQLIKDKAYESTKQTNGRT
jgi:hypothetical protein